MASLTVWKQRPVFITSTFRDMHAERDWLRTRVFPELAEQLRERFHHLEWIDLRWGVEEADPKSAQNRELLILKVCFNEIERSRPFLIGLLGDRYGWCPPDEHIRAAAGKLGFEKEIEGKSVTELEILYGVLDSPDQQQRSRFYLRQPLPYEQMFPETAGCYSEKYNPEPGADKAVKKLHRLKQRIMTELPDRWRPYTAQWDEQNEKVTGLDEWGRQVLEDIWEDLNAATADYLQTTPQTWQEVERWGLELFINERMRVFVGRTEVINELLSHCANTIENATTNPICVTGSEGSGKSSLFGQLYRQLRKQPNIFVLGHSAGITLYSTQFNRMLRRWTSELAQYLGAKDPLEETVNSEKTKEEFTRLLTDTAKQQRVVILIDGLNHFEKMIPLHFLSELNNVRLIATTVPGPASEDMVSQMNAEESSLPPLTEYEARKIVQQICAKYHRKLGKDVVDTLIEKCRSDGKKAFENPLWLEIAVEELNLIDADDFARADREFEGSAQERLQQLLFTVATELPADINKIYGHMLERSEELFDRDWAQSFVNLIALSRTGWRETDLQALMSHLSYIEWDGLNFAHLRRIFRAHVVQRGTQGQWDFSHSQMRSAVLNRNLRDLEKQTRLHSVIAFHLESLPPDSALRHTELMWHLVKSGDKLRAAQYYASNLPSSELTGADEAVLSFIAEGQTRNPKFRREWIESLLSQEELEDREIGVLAWRVGDLISGYRNIFQDVALSVWAHQLALNCRERQAKMCLRPTESLSNNLANISADNCVVIRATEETMQQYAEIRDNFDDPRGPAVLRGNIAESYIELWDKAYQLYKEDRESEALAVLIDGLWLPPDGQTGIKRIKLLLGGVDTSSLEVHQVHPIFLEEKAKINPELVLIPQFLILMGMALSPILSYTPNKCEDAEINIAEAYVEIVLSLFPNSPTLITLAAQVNCCLGKFDSAVMLCEKALHIDPRYKTARGTLDIIQNRSSEGKKNTEKERIIQGEWPTAGGNIARTGVAKGTIQSPLTLQWTFDNCNNICCGITSNRGIVVFGDCYGKGERYWILAVDVLTGRELWRYELPGMVFGTPTIVGDRVFVGDGKVVTCLNLVTGRRQWFSETDNSTVSPLRGIISTSSCLLHIAGRLFMTDDFLVAFRAEDGKIISKMAISHDTSSHTGPCADERFVYFPYSSTEILRMNRSTGELESPIHIDGKVCSGPVVAGSKLLYGTNRKTLQAVSLETLSNCWTRPFSGEGWFVTSRPAVSDGKVFLGGPNGNFYCLNLVDGKLLWKVSGLGDFSSPPIVCGDKVFQFTSTDCLLFSVENGKVLWRYKVGNWSPANCAPAFAEGFILVGWDKLYAFRGT